MILKWEKNFHDRTIECLVKLRSNLCQGWLNGGFSLNEAELGGQVNF